MGASIRGAAPPGEIETNVTERKYLCTAPIPNEELYRLCSLVRAEIRKVRVEPELLSASPAVGAAPAGN